MCIRDRAEGEEIEFDFNYVSSLAPHKGRFELNPVTGKPLLEAIDQIKLIKRKFDLAEHVQMCIRDRPSPRSKRCASVRSR